jgi:lipoyl(octanoyl) transferase
MSIEIKISKRPISYKYAINFLQKRVKDIKNKKCNELLWVLEHPTTFTAGIRSEKKEILDKRINIISTNRGGKITLHNPGQKIIYFVLDLNNRKKDLRKLISTIEKSIIEFLNFYDLKGIADRKNIGVWVNKRKIAAIGIKVSRWIAYHGCSININNNLEKYLKIVPCGLDNNKITSILNEKKIIKKNNNKKLINIFLKNFKNF